MISFSDRLSWLRRRAERLKGERDKVRRDLEARESELERERKRLRQLEEALEIVKQVGLLTQKQLEYHLSEQVSLALDAVFDDPYRLKINFLEKRGQTEVEILFSRRGMEFPPIGYSGGGVIDVASLALRMAYLRMRRDERLRPVLLLDEPFSQLKGEAPNLRALEILRAMSRDLGIQIIMVSDERVPREDIIATADRVFHVSQRDGISVTRVIEGKAS